MVTHTTIITLPLKTVSETNVREHWSKRHKRRKAQRDTAHMLVLTSSSRLTRFENFPMNITLTRIGKMMMDSDNLSSSCKAIRDGVADALGLNDGDKQITWQYAQRIGKEYAVEVMIEKAGPPIK